MAIGSVVPRVLADLGFEAAAAVAQLAEHWESAVGAEVARRCRPVALRGKRLEVQVESSAWAQRLSLKRPQLLAAVRATLGEDAADEIWFRVAG